MKMTRRKLLVMSFVPLALAIAVGLYRLLPAGPGVMEGEGVKEGMTRTEVEEIFGRPVETVRIRTGDTVGTWELRDGWLMISFDADNRVAHRNTIVQGWYDRKRLRFRSATGW
jgi:hypothetical protein